MRLSASEMVSQQAGNTEHDAEDVLKMLEAEEKLRLVLEVEKNAFIFLTAHHPPLPSVWYMDIVAILSIWHWFQNLLSRPLSLYKLPKKNDYKTSLNEMFFVHFIILEVLFLNQRVIDLSIIFVIKCLH